MLDGMKQLAKECPVEVVALGAPVYGDDEAAARKAASAEQKAEAVRKAEVKSLKQASRRGQAYNLNIAAPAMR